MGLSSPCQESCWLRHAGRGWRTVLRESVLRRMSAAKALGGREQLRPQEAHHFASFSNGFQLALFSNRSNFPKEMENLNGRDK